MNKECLGVELLKIFKDSLWHRPPLCFKGWWNKHRIGWGALLLNWTEASPMLGNKPSPHYFGGWSNFVNKARLLAVARINGPWPTVRRALVPPVLPRRGTKFKSTADGGWRLLDSANSREGFYWTMEDAWYCVRVLKVLTTQQCILAYLNTGRKR